MNRSRPPSPVPPGGASPTAIVNAAAEWLIRRDAGMRPSETEQFQQWLAADPRHGAAVVELASTWAQLNQPRLAGRRSAFTEKIAQLEHAAAFRRRRRWFGFTGTSLAAAAAITGFFFTSPVIAPFSSESSTIRTVTVRPDDRRLPDGSQVELNAGAEIAVEFSSDRRGVRLLRGEALFSVVKDPDRPFIVTAGNVEVRAIGTAFAVRHDPNTVDVLVTQGRVAVGRNENEAGRPESTLASPSPLAESASTRMLVAGQQLVVSTGVPLVPATLPVVPVSPSKIAEALAWRLLRVEFTATPLVEAVPLFNRGARTRLALADTATGELRITGIFWTDDAEGFARLLESSLGLAAGRGADGVIVLRQ